MIFYNDLEQSFRPLCLRVNFSPNDASLAAIVQNGQGISLYLPLTEEYLRSMAITMAANANLTNISDQYPRGTSPKTDAHRPPRNIMWAAPVSPLTPSPFQMLYSNPPLHPMPRDLLGFEDSEDGYDELINMDDKIASPMVSSSSLSPARAPKLTQKAVTATGNLIDIIKPLPSTRKTQPPRLAYETYKIYVMGMPLSRTSPETAMQRLTVTFPPLPTIW